MAADERQIEVPPARILAIGGNRHHYDALIHSTAGQWEFFFDPNALPDPDLALTTYETYPPCALWVADFVRRGIPSLHVADGILEWRNTWERVHSQEEGMPLFQPVLAHKIACLGKSQARTLESWGNLGKCEVVGAPRFDNLIGRTPRKRPEGEPFRILVMTARQPGFTPRQAELILKSLLDLKAWFEGHERMGEVRIDPLWRLTGDLPARIGISAEPTEFTGKELAAILPEMDAVISTPSTALIEGMLQGVPVALLDYTNSPDYVPAAWRITAPNHLDMVLPELLRPSDARLLYQDTVLHDALECRTPATPRLVRLAAEMIRISRERREKGIPLSFPPRMLPPEGEGHHLPEERFDLRRLYPNHPVFGKTDVVELQTELGHLSAWCQRQDEEIARLTSELSASSRESANARRECERCKAAYEDALARGNEIAKDRDRYKASYELIMNKPIVKAFVGAKRALRAFLPFKRHT